MSIPSVEPGGGRDLVRAREDCRGDLMRARHRLSKLLLRHGIVYYGGAAWTDAARSVAAGPGGAAVADAGHADGLRCRLRARVDVAGSTRERLDSAIEDMAADSEFTPVVRRMSLPAWGGHVDRVRVGGRDRRLEPVHRQHDRFVHRAGALGVLVGFHTDAGTDHQDREHSRAPATGRGGLASPSRGITVASGDACTVGQGPAAARARGDEGNRRLHNRWVDFLERRKRSTVANVAIARELAGWCWSLAVMDD